MLGRKGIFTTREMGGEGNEEQLKVGKGIELGLWGGGTGVWRAPVQPCNLGDMGTI